AYDEIIPRPQLLGIRTCLALDPDAERASSLAQRGLKRFLVLLLFHGSPSMRLRIALASLLFAIACGSDSTTGPTAVSLAGTWNLQSINGSSLPFVIAQTGANKAELVSDVVTVVSTGSFTEITTVRSTINGQVTTS